MKALLHKAHFFRHTGEHYMDAYADAYALLSVQPGTPDYEMRNLNVPDRMRTIQ